MARFYGLVEGTYGRYISRCGTKKLTTQASGWNVGVQVDGKADGKNDHFRVTLTAGSAANDKEVLVLAEVKYADGKIYVNGKPIR